MSTAEATDIVAVSGVGTRLGGQWLLRGVDLVLRQGETLAVIGPSGGGKSLILSHMLGLRAPDEGQVEVFGISMQGLTDEDRRRISRRSGVLFQQGALFSALTIYDNIAFPIRELRKDGIRVDEDMIDDLVRLKLSMVGLKPEVAGKLPSELSGGMIKRAALARALALDNELLFLDEPTSGLDPASAREFDELYLGLHEQIGLSGLIVTHDRDTLAALADRVAVLGEGRILTTGTLAEVADYDHPFTRQFFAPRADTGRRSDSAG